MLLVIQYLIALLLSTLFMQDIWEKLMKKPAKIITQTELLKNRKCFYSIGYYNNFLGKYEFMDTWVRNDEVVTMQVYYPIKDKKRWYERLKVIIKNAYCR
jgi:hypothetical protein